MLSGFYEALFSLLDGPTIDGPVSLSKSAEQSDYMIRVPFIVGASNR